MERVWRLQSNFEFPWGQNHPRLSPQQTRVPGESPHEDGVRHSKVSSPCASVADFQEIKQSPIQTGLLNWSSRKMRCFLQKDNPGSQGTLHGNRLEEGENQTHSSDWSSWAGSYPLPSLSFASPWRGGTSQTTPGPARSPGPSLGSRTQK